LLNEMVAVSFFSRLRRVDDSKKIQPKRPKAQPKKDVSGPATTNDPQPGADHPASAAKRQLTSGS
jgi:hypothetical protein